MASITIKIIGSLFCVIIPVLIVHGLFSTGNTVLGLGVMASFLGLPVLVVYVLYKGHKHGKDS